VFLIASKQIEVIETIVTIVTIVTIKTIKKLNSKCFEGITFLSKDVQRVGGWCESIRFGLSGLVLEQNSLKTKVV